MMMIEMLMMIIVGVGLKKFIGFVDISIREQVLLEKGNK